MELNYLLRCLKCQAEENLPEGFRVEKVYWKDTYDGGYILRVVKRDFAKVLSHNFGKRFPNNTYLNRIVKSMVQTLKYQYNGKNRHNYIDKDDYDNAKF